jgi:hypothetical protein
MLVSIGFLIVAVTLKMRWALIDLHGTAENERPGNPSAEIP